MCSPVLPRYPNHEAAFEKLPAAGLEQCEKPARVCSRLRAYSHGKGRKLVCLSVVSFQSRIGVVRARWRRLWHLSSPGSIKTIHSHMLFGPFWCGLAQVPAPGGAAPANSKFWDMYVGSGPRGNFEAHTYPEATASPLTCAAATYRGLWISVTMAINGNYPVNAVVVSTKLSLQLYVQTFSDSWPAMCFRSHSWPRKRLGMRRSYG